MRPLRPIEAPRLEEISHRWRWVPRAYLAVATLLVPWVVYLGFTLPTRHSTTHYRIAWVGFDIWLTAVLLRVAWFAWRRNPNVFLTATIAGTLLVADAWFDLVTASPGADRVQAIAAALLLELPGAAICMTLAFRGYHVLLARAAATGIAPDSPWRR